MSNPYDGNTSGDGFHVVLDGRARGPCPSDEIAVLIAEKKIGPLTSIWREGMDGWREATTVDAFVRAFPQINKSLPPPLPPVSRKDAKASTSLDTPVSNRDIFELTLPLLDEKQKISMSDIRDAKENVYLSIIWVVNCLVAAAIVGFMVFLPSGWEILLGIAGYGAIFVFVAWRLIPLTQVALHVVS